MKSSRLALAQFNQITVCGAAPDSVYFKKVGDKVTFGPDAEIDNCGIALYFVAFWSYQERILERRLIWLARNQLSLGTIKIVAASKMGKSNTYKVLMYRFNYYNNNIFCRYCS